MKSLKFLILLFWGSLLNAQIPAPLTVTTFTDFSYENVEPSHDYNFDYPVYADILDEDPLSYEPEYNNRYFMSIYGPRHKSVSTSNIGYFDFHKGSDMTPDVSYNGVEYDDDNAPDIHCMCDGEIYEIFTGPNPENTGTGMYVTVKCDSVFQANSDWENIYTAYRHLDSIEPGLNEGDSISKGDVVGVMGESGYTSNVHLHFSVIRRNTGSQINVHPMRLFNPDSIPHLLSHLTTAEITQLEHSTDEALFRIAVPYNMANIRAIEVSLDGGGYEKIYDFEAVSQLAEEDRDDNDAVEGLELFAYPFNRGHSCYRRVWDKYEDNQITLDYPACPDLGSGNFFPFLSEGLHQAPSYVLDLRVLDLPANFDIEDLNIKVIDIWGYGVEANGTTQASDEHFAWAMITDEDDDAEEYETGTMSLSSPDLELVYDGSHGNQTVGLLFRDLEIPANTTISDAFVQFRADASHAGATDLTIRAEDSGTVADFSSSSNDLSDRDTTYASANWQPAAWTIGDMGAVQKWTDLEGLVQEVVTRGDWTTNSPLTFLITGTGRREAEGYASYDLWKGAYVYVEYTDDVATAPNEPPTITLTSPADGAEYSDLSPITLSADASDPNDNLEVVYFFVDGSLVDSASSNPYEVSWNVPDYGSYIIHAIAVDEDGLAKTSETATISVLDNVLDIQIRQGSDDVEELENGTIWKTNSDLELCYDDYVSGSQGLVGHQHVGLRFQNVTVPQGAIITNAYIQFTVDETDSDATLITLRGEDVDDADAFSYSKHDVSSRDMTSDSVTWSPAAWTSVGAAGTDQRSPDISSLIQEIVDRGGWSSGNSMVMILYSWDEFKRVAESYDGSAADAPTLHIEFSQASSMIGSNTPNFYSNPSKGKAVGTLNVFPNPVSSGTLTAEVMTDIEEPIQLEVRDLLGRTVATKTIEPLNDTQAVFDTTDWTAGTYLIRMLNREEILEVKKLLIL